MGPVNIGVVGLGTVGAGTVEVLQKKWIWVDLEFDVQKPDSYFSHLIFQAPSLEIFSDPKTLKALMQAMHIFAFFKS